MFQRGEILWMVFIPYKSRAGVLFEVPALFSARDVFARNLLHVYSRDAGSLDPRKRDNSWLAMEQLLKVHVPGNDAPGIPAEDSEDNSSVKRLGGPPLALALPPL